MAAGKRGDVGWSTTLWLQATPFWERPSFWLEILPITEHLGIVTILTHRAELSMHLMRNICDLELGMDRKEEDVQMPFLGTYVGPIPLSYHVKNIPCISLTDD